MGEWRWIVAELRNEVNKALNQNITTWKLHDLKMWLNDVEADFAIRNSEEILDKINNPHREYNKFIDSYIRYVKEENSGYLQYTQLVITAGYATYFGLWSIAKDNMGAWESTISFLLIALSAFSFIFVEVAKIGIKGFRIHIKNQALLIAKIEDTVDAKQHAVDSMGRYDNALDLWSSRIWIWSYPISVITGIFAIGIIAYSLIYAVIQNSPWFHALKTTSICLT